MEAKRLLLTLRKAPFEVMVTGEKKEEFRKPSKWIESRLFDKSGNPREYDEVLFVNGYGSDKPCFRADYKGFEVATERQSKSYSNGLNIYVPAGFYVIKLGKVTTVFNPNQHTE